MSNAAIVTGASSGIGFEISRTLWRLGYEVFGIGRNFDTPAFCGDSFMSSKGNMSCGNIFHPVICDVLDTEKLLKTVKEVAAGHRVSVLVNNAGIAFYGPHEELNPKKIQQMVRTNLEVPMILTQQLLRDLKKNGGYVINIASVTAYSSNPHGCAYGAAKAGLLSFSRSLFDEVRKYGVKVVTISPDMTATNLYRNADFTVGDEEESYLVPKEAADAVEYVLTGRDGLVISEITLKPQLHRIKRKQKS